MNERKSYVQRATKSLNLKQQMKYREVNFSYDVLKKERERERKKKNVSGRKKIHFAWHSMHGYKFAIRQYVIWFTIFFCLKIVEKYDICRTNVQTCIHCCSRNSVLNFSLWKNYLGNAYVPANTNILKIARIFHFSLFLERNFIFFFFFFFCNELLHFSQIFNTDFHVTRFIVVFCRVYPIRSFLKCTMQQHLITILWLFLSPYFSKLEEY